MTDSLVEKIITDRLLTVGSISQTAKCYQYYMENKDSENPHPAFIFWKPEYPAESSDDERLKIDSAHFYYGWDSNISFLDWYLGYSEYYGLEDSDREQDELYDEIKNLSLNFSDKKLQGKMIKLIDTNNDIVFIPKYPVVFENLISVRSEVSDNFHKAWYEFNYIPNPPVMANIKSSGSNWWSGRVQVNICLPLNIGTEEIISKYDEIAEVFKPAYIHQGLRIERVYRTQIMTEDDFVWSPVMIEWKAYIPV